MRRVDARGAACAAVALLWLCAAALATAQPAPPVLSPAPVSQFEYDAQGKLKLVRQAGNATTRGYDSLDRLRTIVDARAGVSELGYEGGGQEPVSFIDPRRLQTQSPRDGLGQVRQLSSPDTGTAVLSYDAAGNPTTRLDSRGVLTTYSHDALNRRTSATFTWGSQPALVLGWRYDEAVAGYPYGIGRLTSTTYPGGSTRYGYDAQGRLTLASQLSLTGTAQPLSLHTRYEYDAAGRVVRLTYPSGRVLAFDHVSGLLQRIRLSATAASDAITLIDQISHEPFGAVHGWAWQMAAGTQNHERLFDRSGRMVRHPVADLVRDVAYDEADRISAYRHVDRLTGRATSASAAVDQDFSYDENGRLTAAVQAQAQFSYGYDANGNRTVAALNGPVRSYQIDAQSNRLLGLSNPTRQFTHDPAGNTLYDTQSPASWSAGYDLSNRLATLAGSSGTRAAVSLGFQYNASGQRIAKLSAVRSVCGLRVQCLVVAPTATVFVYDQNGHLLGEYSARDGAMLREYIWLHDMPVAVMAPDGAAADNTALYFIHTDHLDTPRAVVDRQGRTRWTWIAGDPFGSTRPDTNPQGLGEFVFNLRFAGQYFDEESGLMHNGFRDFDASLGRYVQSDPIGLAGGTNTYTYAESQPTSLTDPLGLTSYMCTQPLHALGDKWGPRMYPESRFNPSPLYHQFVCVPDGKGGMSCGGQDRAEGPFGPGKPSTDTYKPDSCKPVDEKQCVEQCLLTEINNPSRPAYALFGGGGRNAGAMNCQQWADKKVQQCQQQCKAQ